MSEDGKHKAESKVELPGDGGLFGPIPENTQKERRAAQAFLSMLVRNPKRVNDGFVGWVDRRAKLECGDLYRILVHPACEKRLSKNKRLRDSQKENGENNDRK